MGQPQVEAMREIKEGVKCTMRIVAIEINGKSFDLVYSNRVMMRLEQEKTDPDSFTGVIIMLSAMMEAGDRLAKLEGRPGKGFMTVDELADLLAPQDISAAMQSMQEAQLGDRNVEALGDTKNAGTAPSGA